ncbi:hypothetical protein ACTI_68820 [Actinoplanes sp. OR16]|nr:hypothetical protein ACTI_68820 [Actinoplanes sp. OR16]
MARSTSAAEAADDGATAAEAPARTAVKAVNDFGSLARRTENLPWFVRPMSAGQMRKTPVRQVYTPFPRRCGPVAGLTHQRLVTVIAVRAPVVMVAQAGETAVSPSAQTMTT